ncbi:hypothetical protein DL769_009150 [Monosporascus sp. CRB-8-3]|nr:hypothetical protein DL769_009150 [Monosporascus sp. CRB-8-3]
MAPTRPAPRPKPTPRPLTPAEARAKNGVLTQNGTKFLCNGGKCRAIKNTTKDVASHICKKHPPEGKTSAYQRFLENAASPVHRCDKCDEAFTSLSKLDSHKRRQHVA